jgi:diguanylate cyclase (GGDEF)-like protein
MPGLVAKRQPASHQHELSDGRALSVAIVPTAEGGWLLSMEDVTAQRRAGARLASRLAHGAHHDPLTGLPNRILFHRRLLQAAARGRRGEESAVLCLDLDHFKAVNDTLGHAVGDALLKTVTSRLRQQIRSSDAIARLGGDEFAILQCGPTEPAQTAALAERIIDALVAPYSIDGHQVAIGVSVGSATIPKDGQLPSDMLRNADLALYRAKADGRGRYRCFEPAMDALMQARRLLELDLRKALVAGEFELVYHPQVDVQSRIVTGFEALLRWRHPTRGLLQPIDFVPFAEEFGLGVPLGEWTLRRACADAAGWPGHFTVTINLSAALFASRCLIDHVAAAMDAAGLDPARVELDLAETAMLKAADSALTTLQGLRRLGVGVAIDDFGAGASSLNALRRFPFSRVKIDRSFIEQLGEDGDCDAIVGAVTELCSRLGLRTTAEGVETEGQFAYLQGGSCSEVQGYLFSHPIPAAGVPMLCRLLNSNTGRLPNPSLPSLPPLVIPLVQKAGRLQKPDDRNEPDQACRQAEQQVVVVAEKLPHA